MRVSDCKSSCLDITGGGSCRIASPMQFTEKETGGIGMHLFGEISYGTRTGNIIAEKTH